MIVVTSALLSKMARDLEADLSALTAKDDSSSVYTETTGILQMHNNFGC